VTGARQPRGAVVVVSYNTCADLLCCLSALETNVTVPVEIVVVDNASSDGSAAAVRAAFPDARVLENEQNVGFSRANNRGVRETSAAYVLILNSDAELRPGCLETLCALLDRRAELGAVGPRTLGADGSIQLSFGPALTPLAERRQRRLVKGVRARSPAALREVERLASREHEPDWLSASCLLARRAALEAVGGFDEGFFLYEEDVDLCLRLRRAGWRLLFTPSAEVVHQLGRSMEKAPALARLEYDRSHLRYYRKHNGRSWTLALRLAILASAGLGWLRAVGPGAERQERRSLQLRRVRLAVGVRS
jgi:GT2 family glycosyltransferase